MHLLPGMPTPDHASASPRRMTTGQTRRAQIVHTLRQHGSLSKRSISKLVGGSSLITDTEVNDMLREGLLTETKGQRGARIMSLATDSSRLTA